MKSLVSGDEFRTLGNGMINPLQKDVSSARLNLHVMVNRNPTLRCLMVSNDKYGGATHGKFTQK